LILTIIKFLFSSFSLILVLGVEFIALGFRHNYDRPSWLLWAIFCGLSSGTFIYFSKKANSVILTLINLAHLLNFFGVAIYGSFLYYTIAGKT